MKDKNCKRCNGHLIGLERLGETCNHCLDKSAKARLARDKKSTK